MTLKIVSNNGTNEVHSVRVDDGRISIISIENGESVSLSDMEKLFPNFKNAINESESTLQVLENLTLLNPDYIWAHVSSKI